VTEVVIDASIAIRWLEPTGTPGGAPAQSLFDEFEAGRLNIVVPPLLFLEILNVAGRRWHWAEARLVELTTRLAGMFEDVVPPDLGRVAVWTARGLERVRRELCRARRGAGHPAHHRRPADHRRCGGDRAPVHRGVERAAAGCSTGPFDGETGTAVRRLTTPARVRSTERGWTRPR